MDYLGFGYALLIAVGGVMGFVKAGSVMSLAMGLIFGVISGIGAYQLSQNPNNYILLLCSSGVLMGIMGYRFSESGKFMPAGLVAALSLLMFVRLGLRFLGVVGPTVSMRSS